MKNHNAFAGRRRDGKSRALRIQTMRIANSSLADFESRSVPQTLTFDRLVASPDISARFASGAGHVCAIRYGLRARATRLHSTHAERT
ncbi:hypothetical protein [Paraburkholderia tropica]|uniref:hypothetical protein n=1 Tax=Paraburkholderia tropica TaxID=92647 RepID=UPI002ABDA874|nr:hypothetical protein [Paraburkholderia tropica]